MKIERKITDQIKFAPYNPRKMKPGEVMTDKQNEKLLRQCDGLIKKCKELDRAMSLSKKKAKDLTKAESKELRNLENKLLRWLECEQILPLQKIRHTY